MSCRSLGVPPSPLNTLFTAIQSMLMKVRTGFGESAIIYGGSSNFPLQGVCQGNGAIPSLWMVISSILIQILLKQQGSSILTSAMYGKSMDILGFMYVDDTDLLCFGNHRQQRQEIEGKLLNMVHCWQNALVTAGGTLIPEKCYWYSVNYIWTNGQCKYDQSSNTQLTIHNNNNTHVTIIQLHPNDSKEVVGVWISPSGNDIKQADTLHQCAENMAIKISG